MSSSPPEEKDKEEYPEARGWLGNDFRASGESLHRIVLQDGDLLSTLEFFSWILVWTQLPTTGVSASVVLAFFAATPVAAPAAVELLLPIKVTLNGDHAGMGGRKDATQEWSARKKMMIATEWGKQLLPLGFFFYPFVGNHWSILAVRSEGEAAGWIWPSMCQHHARRGLHYAQ
jgi:hypothetical protein